MEGVGGLLPLEASHFKLTRQWQQAPDTVARDPPTDMADVSVDRYD